MMEMTKLCLPGLIPSLIDIDIDIDIDIAFYHAGHKRMVHSTLPFHPLLLYIRYRPADSSFSNCFALKI